MKFNIGCMKHKSHLEGTPRCVADRKNPNFVVWEIDITEDMRCAKAEENEDCTKSWRLVAL